MDSQELPPKLPSGNNADKPVAYDQYGRPLYAHPPAAQSIGAQYDPRRSPNHQAETHRNILADKSAPQNPAMTNDTSDQSPQVVYMSRAIDPQVQEPSSEVKARHEESTRAYPQLNLSEHEYVISAIRRHPIGLFSIWTVVALGILIIFIGFPLLISASSSFGGVLSTETVTYGGLTLLLVAILFALGGIMATVVYQANRFFLTNESVIQQIQTSLFSKKDQTISLVNIEDASYRQKGILQTIFNYGAIRLSTEGEETTYRFNYVANPKKQIDILNNAVEAFKNFRPVDPGDN